VKRIERKLTRLVLNNRPTLFAILVIYSTVPAAVCLVSGSKRSWSLAAVIITYSLGAAYLTKLIHPLFGKEELQPAARIVGDALSKDLALDRTTERTCLDSRLRHDLMNSVNVVMGFADLLSAETAGTLNKKQQRYVHVIRVGIRQMLGLVNSKSERTTREETSDSSESLDEAAQIRPLV
jgi:signal transduction histidine kinase